MERSRRRSRRTRGYTCLLYTSFLSDLADVCHLIFLCDLNVCFDFHLFSPHALLTVSRIFFPLICKKGLTIRTYAAQTVGSLLLIILHVVCSTLNTVSRITNPFYHAGVFCARGKETRTIPGVGTLRPCFRAGFPYSWDG